MKLFLDTSSLLKLYHSEKDTEEIEFIFLKSNVTDVLLSEITKVEFASAIWKKVRTKEISPTVALTKIRLFDKDASKYTFSPLNSIIIEEAKFLIWKYKKEGLRTLDSIQLATYIILSKQVDLFHTSDKLLKTLLKKEGLPIELSTL